MPHELAGKPAPAGLLIDLSKLERDYFEQKPDLADPHQLVSFGTSGYLGSRVPAWSTGRAPGTANPTGQPHPEAEGFAELQALYYQVR